MTDNDALVKPDKNYNMEDTGAQVNNKSGRVLASKSSKWINTVTSTEKGEMYF